jgi:hypothetical protein
MRLQRNKYKISVRKPVLSSHRHTWEENNKTDLEEIRYEGLVSG